MNIFWNGPKWLQINTHIPKIIPKWPQSVQNGTKMMPNDAKTAPTRSVFGTPGGLRASWASKICRENVYFMFMGPSGSDTRRYNMHCKCHSMSICHSWGTFFTFRPLSPIIFMKTASKAMSSWPHGCIKSLKSIGKMYIWRKRTKVTPNQHSYT